jgi:hypothetical protein
MIESLMSAWIFFLGGLLGVLCFIAGFISGSKFWKVGKEMENLLKGIQFKMNRLQRKIDDQDQF